MLSHTTPINVIYSSSLCHQVYVIVCKMSHNDTQLKYPVTELRIRNSPTIFCVNDMYVPFLCNQIYILKVTETVYIFFRRK